MEITVGKSANQQAWNEFQRIDRLKQDESFENDPPLTEEEKAAAWDDSYWERLDAAARYVGAGRYVWGEMGRVG
jgi:hypothetical protein